MYRNTLTIASAVLAAVFAVSTLPAIAAGYAGQQESTGTSIKSEVTTAGHKVGQAFDDSGTTASIKSKLLTNKNTNGMAISVTTTDGVVTLSGKVKSDAEKSLAEQIARNTSGVVDVHNELTTTSSS